MAAAKKEVKYPVAAFTPIAAQIAIWKKDFTGLIVSDGKSLDGVKKARKEVRESRTGLEKLRKAAGDDLRKKVSAINSAAAGITLKLREIEDPLDVTIKAWEKKKADEKIERDRLAKEAKDKIMARILAIQSMPINAVHHTADEIRESVKTLLAIDASEGFGEYASSAAMSKDLAHKSLMELIDKAETREDQEAENTRLAEENKKLREAAAESKKSDPPPAAANTPTSGSTPSSEGEKQEPADEPEEKTVILQVPAIKEEGSVGFKAIWSVIKGWKIQAYEDTELEPASPMHARAIYDAIQEEAP